MQKIEVEIQKKIQPNQHRLQFSILHFARNMQNLQTENCQTYLENVYEEDVC